MPRTRYTLAELQTRLSERVGNQSTFWVADEFRDALNEAIAFWQASTGEWTTRASIEAKSTSPNFYPVPKQIASVTRVGLFDVNETLNPLGGTILPSNIPVFLGPREGRFIYSTATGQPIEWRFHPNGGVPPYLVTWEWGDGTPQTVGGLAAAHTFPKSLDQTQEHLVTATVTDAAKDTFVVTFELDVIDQTILLTESDNPIGPSITVAGVALSDQWVSTPWMQLRALTQYNGDTSTDGNYAVRFPMHVEWDFLPTGTQVEGGDALVEGVHVADSAQVIQQTLLVPLPLKLDHTIENYWHFNDGAVSPGFPFQDPDSIGGGEGPATLQQDPDNMQYDVDGDGYGERGYVRVLFNRGWFEDQPGDVLTNFTVKVTDGTGYTAEVVTSLITEQPIPPVFSSVTLVWETPP